jgi:hypothetical protein
VESAAREENDRAMDRDYLNRAVPDRAGGTICVSKILPSLVLNPVLCVQATPSSPLLLSVCHCIEVNLYFVVRCNKISDQI